MYSVLGWLNVGIAVVILSPFWLTFLNKHVFHTKSKDFTKFVGMMRKVHKPLGLALAVLAFVHGYLALGSIHLHTGLVAALLVSVICALGASFYFAKKKALFKWHRALALVFFCILAVHLIFPGALNMLL